MPKTMMVVKQPPPSFLAPQPAATPRKSLLMCSVKQLPCQLDLGEQTVVSLLERCRWPQARQIRPPEAERYATKAEETAHAGGSARHSTNFK
jgi:hypothetical protein